jgi:alginate O-acetyltransferase complex protein AlgI
LAASYFFYGYWDWRFLGLLLLSTVVDYLIGLRMADTEDARSRKRLLCASLAVNLGVLAFFKYFNFFVGSAAVLLESVGFAANLPILSVILPVGISFYTFQTLSYTIDIYRRQLAPTKELLTFALFVAYFPQLVAGPIERAKRLLPLLAARRVVTWPQIAVGVELIIIGYFKKVGVADTLGPLVDIRFARPELVNGADLLLAVYLFTFQIYCDFSGYTDIARGVSRLFGIDLMRNFNQPYLSRSITEFWRRWHISLSSWLRDYLYISLGGNRGGTGKTYRNLILTMLLGGLWHGAAWNFVIWGGIHGAYLVVHKWMGGARKRIAGEGPLATVRNLFRITVTFHLVAFTWIFFRANGLEQAWGVIAGIASWQVVDGVVPLNWLGPRLIILLGTLLVVDVVQARHGSHAVMVGRSAPLRVIAYSALILITVVLGNLDEATPFIYFQF